MVVNTPDLQQFLRGQDFGPLPVFGVLEDLPIDLLLGNRVAGPALSVVNEANGGLIAAVLVDELVAEIQFHYVPLILHYVVLLSFKLVYLNVVKIF